MKVDSRFPLSVIISFLSLIVSTIVLVFGNNIFDRFTGPKIIMNSTEVILDYPDDMYKALDEYADNNKIPFIPERYIKITIQNTGIVASQNANIQIKMGDDIFAMSSYSTENIAEEKQIDDSTYNIQMQRLSKSAYIEIAIWARSSSQPISVIYADDHNSRQLIEGDPYRESLLTIKILMLIVIFGSITFLIKYTWVKIGKNAEEIRLQQDYELLIKLSSMLEDKEIEKVKEEEIVLKEPQGPNDDEETKEKLKRLIKQAKEM